jgi:hypothetical protein
MYTINLGLALPTGGALHPRVALAAITQHLGCPPRRWTVQQSSTEPTIVATLPHVPGLRRRLHELAEALGQDCLAVVAGQGQDWVSGALVGPRAEAWGAFDPRYFLTLDGAPLVAALEAA